MPLSIALDSQHRMARRWLGRSAGAKAVRARPGTASGRGTAQQPVSLRAAGGAGLSADVAAVLPLYREAFVESARRSGLDWRLLAAVGYQESRWNPGARSPTGVRGLMMLTTDTALDLGVDRDDAAQSILGAGRFLQGLYDQLPSQVREPDRTAMALAAYNQGIGHLLDARDVTINRGGDPDHWSDVREALLLLDDPLWQPTTKYGAARGGEAVAFVDSVRRYYSRLADLTPASCAARCAD